MIISASILQYNTFDIKRALDTKISELSDTGIYDYLPYPAIDVQSPYTSGPFWQGDTILIKWNYSEPLNNLIPSTSIYLMSGSNQTLLFENYPTDYKNMNWIIPKSLQEKTTYFIKVQSVFDGQIIADVSPTFTVESRSIQITSKPPVLPIIANQGQIYTITWDEKGTSNYFKIELIGPDDNTNIKFEEQFGRLIRNPDEEQQGEIVTDIKPVSNDAENSNVIMVIEDKYYTTNSSYTWTADYIPAIFNNVSRIKITDIQNLTTAISPEIQLYVPYININTVGRGIQLDLNGPNVITGSGQGDADISAYDFNPKSLIVTNGLDFSFQYSSTNAVKVYLKKNSNPYYFVSLPLSGQYTITGITQDEKYVLSAEDGAQQLKNVILDIKLKTEHVVEETDISKFSLQNLLMYSTALMQEVQTSGDAIIEPNAQVNSRISFYVNEATQTTENTDEQAIWYLLKNLNEEVLKVLLNGNDVSPVVKLFEGTNLKTKVLELNQEIGKRYTALVEAPQKISGYISDSNGSPIIGATVNFSDVGNTNTISDGYYEMMVPYKYDGIVTPGNYSGYKFVIPNTQLNSRSYFNIPVMTELKNQNFTAIVGNQTPIYTPNILELIVTGIPEQDSGATLCTISDEAKLLIDVTENIPTTKYSMTYSEHNYLYIDINPTYFTDFQSSILFVNGIKSVPKISSDKLHYIYNIGFNANVELILKFHLGF